MTFDVDDLAGPVGDDKEGVDRAEPGVVELQEIADPDVVRVVPEEGPPGLAVLPARTDGPHVLLDRPLAHADAELEQFAADPFGAPQPVRLEFPILWLNPDLRQRCVAPDV